MDYIFRIEIEQNLLHKDFRQSKNFKLENILYWALSYSRRIKKIRRFLFQKNSSLFIPIILLLLIKASIVMYSVTQGRSQ